MADKQIKGSVLLSALSAVFPTAAVFTTGNPTACALADALPSSHSPS